jgi:hypothetical protein
LRPDPPSGTPPEQHDTGEFADMFSTDEQPSAPRSHRASIDAPPYLARLMAPATAVVVVIVVIVLMIWINGSSPGKPHAATVGHERVHLGASRSAQPSPSAVATRARPTHRAAAPHRAATATAPVTVLNNSTRTGLAHAVAGQVARKGWHIASIGNLQGLVAQTTVYYPAGERRAAVHLEHEFASIQRVEPNAAGNIHNSVLTLVITRSWQL